MSDPTLREWRFYIDDMIAFAEKVIAYTAGLDQEHFVVSGLNYATHQQALSPIFPSFSQPA